MKPLLCEIAIPHKAHNLDGASEYGDDDRYCSGEVVVTKIKSKKGGSVGGFGFDNARRWRPERDNQNTWHTPTWLLDLVRKAFDGPIGFDPCTTPENPCEAVDFICAPEDGLMQSWRGADVWCNPPFSPTTLERWVVKAHFEAATGRVLILLPSRPETSYCQRAIRTADQVLFFNQCVAFEGLDRHTAVPCMLASYGIDLYAFSDVGTILVRPNTDKEYSAGWAQGYKDAMS